MKSTFHKPQRPSLAVSDAYGKQSCCFPLSYSFLDKIRTATPSLPRKKKHIKTTHIKYAHRSSQCDEVAHPSKHSSCESWASIFKMHLWWPAISSGHHYHCHYQIQTYPPTTAATPPAAVKKCLPGNSRNNIINDTDMNLEFTSVQVFHAVGENSSIFWVKLSSSWCCAIQRLLGFQESFSVPCAKLGEEGAGSGSHHLLRKSPGFLCSQ